MAKPQFQGAAQRKGFNPINMQNNAPQRIMQEANRMADGMRKQANAVLEDRATQSAAMKENYQIQRDAEDRNFEIAMGNLKTQRDSAVGRINERMASQESLFKGIASLSETAAKTAAQIIEDRSAKEKKETRAKFLTDPEYRKEVLARHDANLLENQAALKEANASSVAGQLEGGRPVDASRQINAFKGFSAGEKLAVIDYKFQQFPAEYQAALNSDKQYFDPQTGQNFTGRQALADERLRAIVNQAELDDFIERNGFGNLSVEFLGPGLDSARKYMTKQQAEAADNEQKALDSLNQVTIKESLFKTSDPTVASTLAQTNKEAIWKSFNFDWGKTARYFLEAAYETDYKGNYIMSEPARQALLDTEFGPKGERLRDYKALNAELRRGARVDRINAAREDRGIRTLEGEDFFKKEEENLKQIFDKANPVEDEQAFNTFEAEFYEQFGDDISLPEGYVNLKKQIQNDNKEGEVELLEQATMGMDMTLAQAMSITDDTIREAAVKLVREREQEQYGGNYETLNKTLKGYAKQLTGTDLSSEGISPMGQLLVPELQADFKGYYDAELAERSQGGKLELTPQDYKLAQQKALEKLQQDVIKGTLAQEGEKYARKKNADNNLYEFPNLNLEQRATAAREQYTSGIRSYGKRGDKVFDSRGVILNDKQLQKITDTYNRTGVLDIPPVVMKLSEISGELPIDIINRQIKASDNENFEQIKPPSYYYELKGQSPAVVRLFHDATTPRQRMRALAQLPDQLQKRFETTDFQYLTNTIAGVESESYGSYDAYNTGGADGGHTAFGSGNSAKNLRFGKPISQLTIGEIRRLHNSEQLFATGRYQFIPTTFTEVLRATGLSDDTVFDAGVQDLFFITRLKQRAAMGMSLEEGLRMEWIGLQNLSEKEYRRVVNAARSLLQNN